MKGIKLSDNAPKHKGMLARAMEKDMKDQEQQAEKEKEAIMAEAINDPTFKMKLDRLQSAPMPPIE